MKLPHGFQVVEGVTRGISGSPKLPWLPGGGAESSGGAGMLANLKENSVTVKGRRRV